VDDGSQVVMLSTVQGAGFFIVAAALYALRCFSPLTCLEQLIASEAHLLNVFEFLEYSWPPLLQFQT
jgi:hypothetical protein